MPAPTNQTAIPSVTALRAQLGYGDAKKEMFTKFRNAMASSRDVFVSDGGLNGKDLIDWKSRDQQNALSKMVQSFLDRDGNPQRFWPDDGALDTTKLKFSTDQNRIKDILRQLFWRLNLQDHRNNKSRNPLSKGNDVGKGLESGLHRSDPIDVESHEDEKPPGLRSARERSHTLRADPVDEGPNESELADDASSRSVISRDTYLVPQSPDLSAQAPVQLAPFAEMTPSTKRAREVDSSSARSESSAKRGRTSSTQVANRSSTRQRKPRREPEWATPEQYWAAGESPECPSNLESTGNNPGVSDGATVATATSSVRPTVEYGPQEDPVNDFIDEWTMQQNADTEVILTTTHVPKNLAMSPNTTRKGEAAEKPNMESEVLSVHPSTRTLMSEPVVPEETATKADSQRSENAESNSVGQRTVVAQPKFTYTIMTHYPKYRERHWKPKRGFGQKTLSELLTEFPAWVQLSDVESLQFLMETSNTEVEDVIELGQEKQFEEMKAKFEKAIRMEIARAANSGQVPVKISIDVRTGRDPQEEEMDIENIRFSWS
ncbi:hypothetical protein CGCF415_v009889 [Colletotrichum fructicola]|uniref:Uncharacterized protein n=1 Tax=Colletotrichum fructicola (strain Nara gc5) TaxID=1213859 RepID=L2FAF4_COLFN|nr:hypothetical protein CGCFRS4_v014963 [Colletotrichum fructicola]KAF4900940.1 hypothetical protein CGCF415_v009889 [Colletotrichum fructicola]KAF4934279.1 hypothetical protein CGCF245_v008790 [Colletotrichum fructicola]